MQGPARGPMSMAETRASEEGFPEQGLCSGPRGGCLATVLRATLAHMYRSTSVYVLVCVREGAVWKRNPSALGRSLLRLAARLLPSCPVVWSSGFVSGHSRNGCTAALDCNRGPLPLGKDFHPIHPSIPHLCISSAFKPHAPHTTSWGEGRDGACGGQQG